MYQNRSNDSYLLGEAIAVVAILLRVVVHGGHVRHTAAAGIFVGADEAQGCIRFDYMNARALHMVDF